MRRQIFLGWGTGKWHLELTEWTDIACSMLYFGAPKVFRCIIGFQKYWSSQKWRMKLSQFWSYCLEKRTHFISNLEFVPSPLANSHFFPCPLGDPSAGISLPILEDWHKPAFKIQVFASRAYMFCLRSSCPALIIRWKDVAQSHKKFHRNSLEHEDLFLHNHG